MDASTELELRAKALEARVNRVARELSVETGRPVRAWLGDVAYTLARGLDHEIVDVDGVPTFVVRYPADEASRSDAREADGRRD